MDGLNTQATINLTASGQHFQMPLHIAADDAKLLAVLSRSIPKLAEAEIKHTTVDNTMVVSVTARPDTKGAPRDVAAALRQAPEELNRIMQMYARMEAMQRDGLLTTAALMLLEPEITEATAAGERDAERVKRTAQLLRTIPAAPGRFVPVGF